MAKSHYEQASNDSAQQLSFDDEVSCPVCNIYLDQHAFDAISTKQGTPFPQSQHDSSNILNQESSDLQRQWLEDIDASCIVDDEINVKQIKSNPSNTLVPPDSDRIYPNGIISQRTSPSKRRAIEQNVNHTHVATNKSEDLSFPSCVGNRSDEVFLVEDITTDLETTQENQNDDFTGELSEIQKVKFHAEIQEGIQKLNDYLSYSSLASRPIHSSAEARQQHEDLSKMELLFTKLSNWLKSIAAIFGKLLNALKTAQNNSTAIIEGQLNECYLILKKYHDSYCEARPQLYSVLKDIRLKIEVWNASSLESVITQIPQQSTNPILQGLNEKQIEAVTCDPTKPCLVFAGPGSGKTRILIRRAAYLVHHHHVEPHKIIAVTFTNKAANEMKERLYNLFGNSANTEPSDVNVEVKTIHGLCVQILRRYGAHIGLSFDFDIADKSCSEDIMKSLVRKNEPEPKTKSIISRAKHFLEYISILKIRGMEAVPLSSIDVTKEALINYRRMYDDKLKEMNKVDFNDLLLKARKMIQSSEKIAQKLSRRYPYILVDEWQDTDHVQYDIVTRLSDKKNIFLVGDADQSIYRFRGADVRNLDKINQLYPEAKVVFLKENYRSSRNIVAAAQAVIERNKHRPNKQMRTSNASGVPLIIYEAESEESEGQFIAGTIQQYLSQGFIDSLANVAIFCRTHKLIECIEKSLVRDGIPYKVKGVNFYNRAEIKDMLSYMRLLLNPADDTSLKRIIDRPRRGIGSKTYERLSQIAHDGRTSIMEAVRKVSIGPNANDIGKKYGLSGASLKSTRRFFDQIQSMKAHTAVSDNQYQNPNNPVDLQGLIDHIIQETNYDSYLETNADSQTKLESQRTNLQELKDAATRHSSLLDFLESLGLLVPISESGNHGDGDLENEQKVSLITIHASKGLEFDTVFVAGVEDGLLPLIRFDGENLTDKIEEERRLFYVAMTRAKQRLIMTWKQRSREYISGVAIWRDNNPSAFLDDIPKHLVPNRFE